MKHLGPILAVTLVSILGLTLAAAAQRVAQAPPAQNPSPEICTEVYQPVCGTDPAGKRMTYSNACFARVAKATNVTPGECPK